MFPGPRMYVGYIQNLVLSTRKNLFPFNLPPPPAPLLLPLLLRLPLPRPSPPLPLPPPLFPLSLPSSIPSHFPIPPLPFTLPPCPLHLPHFFLLLPMLLAPSAYTPLPLLFPVAIPTQSSSKISMPSPSPLIPPPTFLTR